MKKRILSLFLSIVFVEVLTFTGETITVSATNVDLTNENGMAQDFISESVLEKGLYEAEKIREVESLTDGIKACHDLTDIKDDSNLRQANSEVPTRYVENCVIVKTAQNIAFDTENVIAAVRYCDNYYIQYKTDLDAQASVSTFLEYPTVEYAVVDQMISYAVDDYIKGDAKTSQDINGYAHYTWGADAMALPIYADYTSRITDGEVVVAVLDSGIKEEHELFQGRLLEGYDIVHGDENPRDDQGHGTHVSGIIADSTQGTNVKILPVKVLEIDPFSLGTMGSVGDILGGLQYAMNANVDVINMSMGATDSIFESVCVEIDKAVAKGITVVAAAGNSNSYITSDNIHPAHKNNIIVTAAVDSKLQNYSKSNYGPSIDVTAPGVDVKSAFHGIYDRINNKYIMKTGTSMSAPHISAAAAILKLNYPNYSCSQIENKLISSAEDLGPRGYDEHYGWGMPVLSNLITRLPFDDVSVSDWYYNDLFKVYKKGYMSGKRENNFMPMDNMKRQDVAVLIYHMSNSPFVEYRSIYNDVSKGDYFANAAVWAYDNGIVTGYSNGKFGRW